MAIIDTQDLAKPLRGEDLTGRVAMVTGGTRGIGAAICRNLVEHGATVAAGFSRDHERAEEFKRELEDIGATVSLHQGNVGSGEDSRRTIHEAIDQHGRLDILVNNAGLMQSAPAVDAPLKDWDAMVAVNVQGVLYATRAALSHLIAAAADSPAPSSSYCAVGSDCSGILSLSRL